MKIDKADAKKIQKKTYFKQINEKKNLDWWKQSLEPENELEKKQFRQRSEQITLFN